MKFTIRPIGIGDARGINELRRMPGVFENTLGISSERLQKNEDYIANMDNNTHQWVAVTDQPGAGEKIIGTIGLDIYTNPRLRHSASLGILVHEAYQGQGVGTRLMETLIDLADNWLMLVRVELTVFTDNTRAIHLYKKFGFVEEGIKRKAAIRNGEYADELIMARIKE